jgi:NADPH:quinone reductase-like Zn-dependent oxidoreductase
VGVSARIVSTAQDHIRSPRERALHRLLTTDYDGVTILDHPSVHEAGMRRWEMSGGFGVAHLASANCDERELRGGEVRLQVRAVSLNYRDLLMIDGQYDPRLPLPLVPASDGVGEVLELGAGVTELAVGDRVCPMFVPGWVDGPPDAGAVGRSRGGRTAGMLSERVVVDGASCVRVPSHLTDAEAATLPCAALTAWSALVTLGALRAGDTVLTLGSGGVSMFALQFARLHGARVAVTTSSEARAEILRSLGAEVVFDRLQEPRWGRAARRWAGGGVDHVVEVGGTGTLGQSLSAVRTGGRISLIGVLAGGKQPLDLVPALMRQITIQGVFVGHRNGFVAMARAIEAASLRPVVDRVFPFDQLPEALAHLRSGCHIGKVVVSAS